MAAAKKQEPEVPVLVEAAPVLDVGNMRDAPCDGRWLVVLHPVTGQRVRVRWYETRVRGAAGRQWQRRAYWTEGDPSMRRPIDFEPAGWRPDDGGWDA